jgi:hypothetical protein
MQQIVRLLQFQFRNARTPNYPIHLPVDLVLIAAGKVIIIFFLL